MYGDNGCGILCSNKAIAPFLKKSDLTIDNLEKIRYNHLIKKLKGGFTMNREKMIAEIYAEFETLSAEEKEKARQFIEELKQNRRH